MSNLSNILEQAIKEQAAAAPKPHRWAEVIKAWADGKEIQQKLPGQVCWGDWQQSTLHEGQHDAPWFDGDDGTMWRIKPEVRTGWINIYPGMLNRDSAVYDSDFAGIWKSEVEANNNRRSHCIACIQITYTEGEGL